MILIMWCTISAWFASSGSLQRFSPLFLRSYSFSDVHWPCFPHPPPGLTTSSACPRGYYSASSASRCLFLVNTPRAMCGFWRDIPVDSTGGVRCNRTTPPPPPTPPPKSPLPRPVEPGNRRQQWEGSENQSSRLLHLYSHHVWSPKWKSCSSLWAVRRVPGAVAGVYTYKPPRRPRSGVSLSGDHQPKHQLCLHAILSSTCGHQACCVLLG